MISDLPLDPTLCLESRSPSDAASSWEGHNFKPHCYINLCSARRHLHLQPPTTLPSLINVTNQTVLFPAPPTWRTPTRNPLTDWRQLWDVHNTDTLSHSHFFFHSLYVSLYIQLHGYAQRTYHFTFFSLSIYFRTSVCSCSSIPTKVPI